MRKKAGIIYLAIAVFIGVLNIIAWNNSAFCDTYIRYIFPVWVNTYGRITGIFPFSVGELLLLAGVICIVIFILLLIVNMALGIWSLLRRKGDSPMHIKNGLWKFSKGYFCFLGWTVLVVCMVMTLNCFILYHGSTFSEQYYGKEDGNYTVEELIKVRNMVVEHCNKLSTQMKRDENGDILYSEDLREEAVGAMKDLGKQYDQLDGYYPLPKPLAASDFFSQQYITGYYFPFSMEANYNNVMYISQYPSTLCHELAHLRGYIYEDEANFIAYLACIGSADLMFQYSGYLSVLFYLDNDLWDALGEDAYIQQPRIAPQVYADNIFLKQAEWDRINDKAVIDTETVDEISDTFTDTVLKANGVKDGMISYSRVVELLLWYYSK